MQRTAFRMAMKKMPSGVTRRNFVTSRLLTTALVTGTFAILGSNNNHHFAATAFVVRNPIIQHQQQYRSFLHPTKMAERKAGVASPEELKEFVEQAGDSLLVVDVRNPDASVEPGDQKSLAVAGLPSDTFRPLAKHWIWDRTADAMEFDDSLPKDTPIITHCGGGGRGQKAKDFLEKQGFTNVLNGGGPKETECWNVFGNK